MSRFLTVLLLAVIVSAAMTCALRLCASTEHPNYRKYVEANCAWCGETVALEVHHILPQSRFPELAKVQSNVITLCRKCHITIGHRNNTTRWACTNILTVIRGAEWYDMRGEADNAE